MKTLDLSAYDGSFFGESVNLTGVVDLCTFEVVSGSTQRHSVLKLSYGEWKIDLLFQPSCTCLITGVSAAIPSAAFDPAKATIVRTPPGRRCLRSWGALHIDIRLLRTVS